MTFKPRISSISLLKMFTLLSIVFLCAEAGFAQEAGNRVYSGGGQPGRQTKKLFGATYDGLTEAISTNNNFTTYAVEAKVLINLPADEYVATFALVQEGPSAEACNTAMEARIRQFQLELAGMGVTAADVFVDFVTQNPIYDYKIKKDNSKTATATEYEAGYELKKNVMIRYTQRELLDRMTQAAAKSQIFDLVKVDFIIRNPSALRERLRAEALGVIKRKLAESEKLLGIRARPVAIEIEKYSNEEPGDLYRSYTAFESADVETVGARSLRVLNKRKPVTLYFEGVDTGEFDVIINPSITSPVAQYGVYLRVRCDPEIQVPVAPKESTPKP